MGDKIKISLLRKLIVMEPDGRLYWRARPCEMFTSERHWKRWNTAFAGKEALACTSASHGYKHGAIFNKPYLAHHVVFALKHGRWPKAVDHKDRSKSNIPENLREAGQAKNCKNQSMRGNNSSGHTGVVFEPKRNKWRARITVDYKEIHLGRFTSLSAAVAARDNVKTRYGFTDEHGT